VKWDTEYCIVCNMGKSITIKPLYFERSILQNVQNESTIERLFLTVHIHNSENALRI
jgi:hypothetical protein